MSLLKCPECQGMVSSRATSCPHCGCPVEQQNFICVVEGRDYDLSEVLDIAKQEDKPSNRLKAWEIIESTTKLQHIDASNLYKMIQAEQAIPAEFHPRNNQQQIPNLPKCPTCGSTNLTKKGAGARAIDGFFFGRLSVEGRAQWRCENCGYLF